MITLEVRNFNWVKGSVDDPTDFCAHGRVMFRVNEITFVRPEDGEWTVSATALYLLRSLTLDHTKSNSIAEGNFLFPCCAFSVWPIKDKFEVICMGCPNGIDIYIRHREGKVSLSSSLGTEIVTESEWKEAVIRFVTLVQTFYVQSSPKIKIEDEYDARGWIEFWREWEQRVSNAEKHIS
jgi:hypothetical protein